MSDLSSNVYDLSDLYVRIKNDCEAIAFRQVMARLKAFSEAVGAKDGVVYRNWKQLPEKALRSLEKKLKAELAAMPPERVKGVAATVEKKILPNDEFF